MSDLLFAIIVFIICIPWFKKVEKDWQKRHEEAAYAALKRLEAEKEKELAEKSRDN